MIKNQERHRWRESVKSESPYLGTAQRKLTWRLGSLCVHFPCYLKPIFAFLQISHSLIRTF